MNKIIHLISGPRNISTALMYSFGNRPDMDIIDEPYYGYYLKTFTYIEHPGKEEVLQTMALEPSEIQTALDQHNLDNHSLFIKNMAHHMEGLDWDMCANYYNLFLIRNPKQLIASFAQVIKEPTMQDIGLRLEFEILEYLNEKGYAFTVVDSNDILKDPKLMLTELCDRIGIEFKKEMLNWESGPRKEDGCWAKYWYANVHQSTGFSKQKTSSREFPKRLQPLLDEANFYYEKLKVHALSVPSK